MKKREVSLPLFDEPPQASMAEVICADVLKWAETYTGPKFHALLTDAPYHLTSGNAVYDLAVTSAGNPRKRRSAQGGGFMGQHWDGMGEDGQGIAFKPETWKALAQHLLPGAFILAFGSSRGWHRLACAMEDAGLRIMPSIFNWRTGETHEIGMYGWANGSSFPKATRIDRAVDQAAGLEPDIIGYRDSRSDYDGRERHSPAMNNGWRAAEGRTDISDLSKKPITAPATPLAQIWAGHRYGGQVLKNSLEPIIVAQVPYAGKPVQSITQTGAGALNIDGGRLVTGETLGRFNHAKPQTHGIPDGHPGTKAFTRLQQEDRWVDHSTGKGRWPANFCMSHLSLPVLRLKPHLPPDTQDAITRYYAGYTEVSTRRAGRNGAVHHGLEVLAGDIPDGWHEYFELTGEDLGCVAQGTRQVNGSNRPGPAHAGDFGKHGTYGRAHGDLPVSTYTDANGMEEVQAWACHESCPVAKLDAQAGVRTSGGAAHKKDKPITNNTVYGHGYGATPDYLGYSGDGGSASRFFMTADWSLDVAERLAQADPAFYCAKASRGERNLGLEHMPATKSSDDGYGTIQRPILERSTPRENWTPHHTANNHPCVKPIALCIWLAKLLLPPAAYAPRRLLIPFSGSGSEGIGATLAGWEGIVMVDSDQSYVNISKQRLAYWSQHKDTLTNEQ